MQYIIVVMSIQGQGQARVANLQTTFRVTFRQEEETKEALINSITYSLYGMETLSLHREKD